MNIQEAKAEIIHTIQAYTAKDSEGQYRIPRERQRPLLLMGPPGIGKTAVMEQAARECQVGLVAYTLTHHTRQSAVGLPMVEQRVYGGQEYTVTRYTMSEIIAAVYEQMEQTGKQEGILFIDEINCVSETLAPTMLQFLQCKTFGNHRVPSGWIIAAAGNPVQYNRSARELDMATLDRVRCLEIEADEAVWRAYASQAGVHGAVLSYLESRPQNFYRVEGEGEERRFVTARGWEDLSDLLKAYEELNIPVAEPVVREYLQCGPVAEEFAAYYQLYQKYREAYPAEAILSGTAGRACWERMGLRLREAPLEERMAVAQLLLDGVHRRLQGWQRDREDAAFLQRKVDVFRGFPGAEPLEAFLEQQERAFTIRRQEQVLGQEEELREERCLQRLRKAARKAREQGAESRADYLQALERLVAEGQEAVRKREQEVGTSIDRAIDWLTAYLGEGQELLLFLADLTRSAGSGRYLEEHPESRYYAYRTLLLVQEQEENLRKQLRRNR